MGEVIKLNIPPRRTVIVTINDVGNERFTLTAKDDGGWADSEDLSRWLETAFTSWARVQQDRRWEAYKAEQAVVQSKKPWYQQVWKVLHG